MYTNCLNNRATHRDVASYVAHVASCRLRSTSYKGEYALSGYGSTAPLSEKRGP